MNAPDFTTFNMAQHCDTKSNLVIGLRPVRVEMYYLIYCEVRALRPTLLILLIQLTKLSQLRALCFTKNTPLKARFICTLGGGYEIAYLVQGKFRKLDHHATSVWSIKIGENGLPEAPLLHSVNLYYYHEDIFAITAISETRPIKDGAVIEKFSHFLAAPLEREVTKEELDNFRPTYSPQNFNHIIEIHYSDMTLRKLRVTEYSQVSAIQFVDDSGLVSIKVNSKLIVDQVIIFEQRRKAHQSC